MTKYPRTKIPKECRSVEIGMTERVRLESMGTERMSSAYKVEWFRRLWSATAE